MNTGIAGGAELFWKKRKISAKTALMEAIEQSLIQACKNHFGKADNVKVTINHETCEFQRIC